MSSTIPSNSPSNHLVQVHSRRLLLHTPLYDPGTPLPGPVLSDPGTPELSTPASTFDANVVMLLAVLLCALICALGLNSIVRCALRCFDSEPGQAVRLATAGVRRKAIRAIPVMVFSPELKFLGSGTECAICLSDLVPGERVRVLPKCRHGFHARCIDRWLMARPSCPTCRQCLFVTEKKSSACRADAGMDAGTVLSIIVPLEPEGYLHNYRGVS